MSLSIKTCRICARDRDEMSAGARQEIYIEGTDLIHLKERPFAHLLEGAYLAGLLLAGEVDLAVAALSDLSDDVELIDAELRAALAEDDALAPAVRLELFVVLGGRERAGGGIGVELGAAVLARADVAQELEVVIEEVCGGARCQRRRRRARGTGQGTAHRAGRRSPCA